MGFFDDIAGIVDDARQLGEELNGLKDEIVSSVTDLGQEATTTVSEVTDALTGEAAEE